MRSMRSYFAYVYGKGAHFEVHEELFCIRVHKRTTFRYGFGSPKGPPEGARDASRPKVVVLTKSYKAKTHRQRTFFFTDFQGVQKGAHFEVHEGLFGIRIRKRSTF